MALSLTYVKRWCLFLPSRLSSLKSMNSEFGSMWYLLSWLAFSTQSSLNCSTCTCRHSANFCAYSFKQIGSPKRVRTKLLMNGEPSRGAGFCPSISSSLIRQSCRSFPGVIENPIQTIPIASVYSIFFLDFFRSF